LFALLSINTLEQLPPIASLNMNLPAQHTTPQPFRLNITADDLASTAYDSSTFEELVPMAPDIGAHLEIDGRTLVFKYKSTPKDIRRTQNIKYWIQEKTGMAEDAFNQVDWRSHTMAVSRSQLPHPFIVKLLHQLLP
jgi:hypothetical protein